VPLGFGYFSSLNNYSLRVEQTMSSFCSNFFQNIREELERKKLEKEAVFHMQPKI